MKKTSHLVAVLALAFSASATGCAVDAASCADSDCIENEAADYAADAELELDEVDAYQAEAARDADLAEIPQRTAALHDFALRVADGEDDECDRRLVRYFEESQQKIDLDGCQQSFIREFVTLDTTAQADNGRELEDMNAGRPLAVAVDALTVEETKWMLLALDISNDSPLTIEQERLLAEADASAFYRQSRVTAEAIVEVEPKYHPSNL